MEWNKLDLNIRNSESLSSFKGNILKFMRLLENSVFLEIIKKNAITNLIKVINHYFHDILNAICNYVKINGTMASYIFIFQV